MEAEARIAHPVDEREDNREVLGPTAAITALIATFSTVTVRLRSTYSTTTSSPGRPPAVRNSRTRAAVGGTTGSPSVHPCA